MKEIKGEVAISLEELEVIRLCDLEEKKQKEAGLEMNVSQSTIFRHLKEAHSKIAKALINGWSIKIDITSNFFHCDDCGYTWPDTDDNVKHCEKCLSKKFHLHRVSSNANEIVSK